MEQGGAQTIATFTGTLLRREHTLGQKFVQLVFREDGKDWLCISTDPRTATLLVGQKYKVEGVFKLLGERPYIHEPRIAAVTGRRMSAKHLAISAAIVLVVATMTAMAVRAVHGSLAPTSAESNGTAQHIRATSAPVAPASATSNPNQQTDTSAAAPAPTTTATPKVTAKKTTIPTPAPAPVPVPTVPAVVPTTPDCDAIVTTPFGTKTVEDDTQTPGYSEITQAGVDGQQQTCYPNGRSAAGVTTTLVAEQDQITTVGPAATQPGP